MGQKRVEFIFSNFTTFCFFLSAFSLYKVFFCKKKNFSIPIICVGNIYIGGTGKTPISIKIFEILKELKMNPVIVKKDHKNRSQQGEITFFTLFQK